MKDEPYRIYQREAFPSSVATSNVGIAIAAKPYGLASVFRGNLYEMFRQKKIAH